MSNPGLAPRTSGDLSLTKHLANPEVKQFIHERAESGRNGQLISLTFPVPAFDPLACLEILSSGNEFNFYWEKPDQDFAFSAGKQQVVLEQDGSDRFKTIAGRVEQLKQTSACFSLVKHSLCGIHLLGGFSFFDRITSDRWSSFGAASLSVPTWLLIRDGKMGLLTITLTKQEDDDYTRLTDRLMHELQRFEEMYRLDGQIDFGSHNKPADGGDVDSPGLPDYRWMNIVDEAKNLIHNHIFEKIVLAREVDWESDSKIAPTHVVNTLRNQYPSCYNFLIRSTDGKTFIGCSPERLVSFQKSYLLTESLAGSIPRGATATEDVYLEKKLYASEKNRNEHRIVIKAIEKRLRPFIRDIEIADTPDVKKLRNVQHLYTPIRARLKKDVDRFAILEQLHPTPAVGGYPREQAVPYIEQLESFDRGWYAGPIGWFNLNGGGEFAVAIRSSLIEDNRARLFAGCGIVEDSDPLAEWEETNLKLTPILSAFEHDEVRQTE